MGTWNKKKTIRVTILGVVVVLVILVGRCIAKELSKSFFHHLVENNVSVLRVDMKCESQDIGTVEHIACQGSNSGIGIFVLFADYPDPGGEFTGYSDIDATEGNMVAFMSCYGGLDVSSLIEDCQTVEEVHISEAVNRLDRMQMAWESGQLRLGRNQY